MSGMPAVRKLFRSSRQRPTQPAREPVFVERTDIGLANKIKEDLLAIMSGRRDELINKLFPDPDDPIQSKQRELHRSMFPDDPKNMDLYRELYIRLEEGTIWIHFKSSDKPIPQSSTAFVMQKYESSAGMSFDIPVIVLNPLIPTITDDPTPTEMLKLAEAVRILTQDALCIYSASILQIKNASELAELAAKNILDPLKADKSDSSGVVTNFMGYVCRQIFGKADSKFGEADKKALRRDGYISITPYHAPRQP